MNNISEQLLQAMDIVMDEKISRLQFDKTIKAKIDSIVNLDTGEYKVRYTGNIFSAFANDSSKTFRIGDDVYVKVPSGNFSNKKIIESKVSDNSLTYSQLVGLQNTMKTVSPPMSELYKDWPPEVYGVVAGAPQEINGQPNEKARLVIQEYEESNQLFAKYGEEYDLLRIKASFKTNFHSEHIKGNYGLEITFFAGDENDNVTYRLDLESFNGAPYGLSVYSPQAVVMKVQKGYLKGIQKIVLFEEDFDYDRYVVAGITKDENTEIPNIFVQDIEVAYVENKDLAKESLFLDISSQKGTILSSAVPSIDLVGQLLSYGEDLLKSSNCKCQWYIRDWSIYVGHEEYDKNAGFGWKKLDNTTNTLTLEDKDVAFRNQYKLVVIYNERTVKTAEIEVSKAEPDYKCELAQVTEDDDIKLKINNLKDDEVLIGDWYMSYPDQTYIQIEEEKEKNTISITNLLKYTTLVFYCQVKKNDEIITNLQYTVVSSESDQDVTVTFEGEDSFRYDANGDVTVEDYEKSRYLKPIITWKDGKGNQFTVQIYGPDKKLLSSAEEPYNPQYSMLQNIRLDIHGIITYNISKKYDINYNNNSIYVTLTTIDGQVYEFEKELLFVKDGDQGLNGSTYVLAIRPCDKDGVKLSGFRPLFYQNGWIGSQNYRCYVYRDGEEISSDNTYRITYNWTGKNVSVTTPKQKMIAAAGTGDKDQVKTEHYLRCEVRVTDLAADGDTLDSDTTLYALYPIDVLINSQERDKVDISTIPSYIKYTASGLSPTFANGYIEAWYGEDDYTSQIDSLTKKLLTIQNRTSKNDDGESIVIGRYLKPNTSFLGEQEDTDMGVLECPLKDDINVIHTIIIYLDTYGNEAINGWDGTKLEIRQEGDEHDYLFAPQIGAGEKDSYNRFVGVLMAKGKYGPVSETYPTSKWGLYGFKEGFNTFGLREDGIAWFGQKGSQIVIDGTSASITGGKQQGSSDGMILTLDSKGDDKTIGIQLGNKFSVNYAGDLTASNINVSGRVEATSGQIAGWKIDGSKLQSIYSEKIYLDGNPRQNEDIVFNIEDNFNINANGEFVAQAGHLGKWHLTEDLIYSDGNYNPDKPELNKRNQATVLNGSTGTIHTSLLNLGYGTHEAFNIAGTIGYKRIISKDDNGNKIEYDAVGIYSTDAVIKLDSGLNNTSIDANSLYMATELDIQLNSKNQISIGTLRSEENPGYVTKKIAITAQEISFDVPADGQTGLYARFA